MNTGRHSKRTQNKRSDSDIISSRTSNPIFKQNEEEEEEKKTTLTAKEPGWPALPLYNTCTSKDHWGGF